VLYWDYRTWLKVLAVTVSIIWLSMSTYMQFLDVDPNEYSFHSPEIEQKMKACTGSFAQRYRCKEDLIIDKGHEGFIVWMGKVALVLAPPIILWSGLGMAIRRRSGDEPDTFAPPPPTSINRRRWR
jgi:hypothetical protein